MHRVLLVGATLLLSGLLGGCSAEATPELPATDEVTVSEATISDAEIDQCIAWWRTRLSISRRHLQEMDELEQSLLNRYLPVDLHKIQEDPELLAMLARHREESAEHTRSHPLPGEKAEGFDSVLAGLRGTVNRDGHTVHEVLHDESALRGARHKYGDKFVDKVLSREDDIAAAMYP